MNKEPIPFDRHPTARPLAGRQDDSRAHAEVMARRMESAADFLARLRSRGLDPTAQGDGHPPVWIVDTLTGWPIPHPPGLLLEILWLLRLDEVVKRRGVA